MSKSTVKQQKMCAEIVSKIEFYSLRVLIFDGGKDALKKAESSCNELLDILKEVGDEQTTI